MGGAPQALERKELEGETAGERRGGRGGRFLLPIPERDRVRRRRSLSVLLIPPARRSLARGRRVPPVPGFLTVHLSFRRAPPTRRSLARGRRSPPLPGLLTVHLFHLTRRSLARGRMILPVPRAVLSKGDLAGKEGLLPVRARGAEREAIRPKGTRRGTAGENYTREKRRGIEEWSREQITSRRTGWISSSQQRSSPGKCRVLTWRMSER